MIANIAIILCLFYIIYVTGEDIVGKLMGKEVLGDIPFAVVLNIVAWLCVFEYGSELLRMMS